MADIRTKIWNLLVDAKTNDCLAGCFVRKYQKYELWTNVGLAVVTSGSVAAWAVWEQDQLKVLWAVLIAISQVLTIIKPYFLFPKYIKVFNEKGQKWQQITVELEELWHEVDNDLVDEANAKKRYFSLRKKTLLLNNMPDDIIFFRFKSLQQEAEVNCETYLNKL